jgi:hypothetical protein
MANWYAELIIISETLLLPYAKTTITRIVRTAAEERPQWGASEGSDRVQHQRDVAIWESRRLAPGEHHSKLEHLTKPNNIPYHQWHQGRLHIVALF